MHERPFSTATGPAAVRPPAEGAGAGTAGSGIRPVTAGGDWTTRRLLTWMAGRFAAAGVEPPRLVAEMLLAHVLGCDRMRLYMEADRPADAEELARLRTLVTRAGEGEPVQLLTGTAHFFGRDFLVDASTLIPQPCTEELVARAVRFLRPGKTSVFDRFDLQRLDRLVEELRADGVEVADPGGAASPAPAPTPDGPPVATDRGDDEARRSDDGPAGDDGGADAEPEPAPPTAAPAPRVADIGTGSGCVAISIALGVPRAQVLATDVADEVLALAARNVARFDVADRVELVRGDGCGPLAARLDAEGPWDVIVSNPPYVPDHEWTGGQVEPSVRRFIPERALRGGPDGLAVLRPILREAPQLLRPGGLLVLECAAAHAEQLVEWAGMHPRLEAAELVEDEDGMPRTLVARRPDA